MKFCPRDKSLLVPVRRGDKTVLRCPNCGYEEEVSQDVKNRYQSKTTVENKNAIIVVDNNAVNLPKVKTRGCPKCGHDEAYVWVQQTRRRRAPDEVLPVYKLRPHVEGVRVIPRAEVLIF